MSERVVTLIFCSKTKPHKVGSVVATDAGLVVRFTIVIDGVHGPQGRPEEMAANSEAAERTEAWCPICSKRLELGINDAAAAAKRGDKSMTLVAEGMWVDPIGVLDRRIVPPPM